jgi:hypothetical protein
MAQITFILSTKFRVGKMLEPFQDDENGQRKIDDPQRKYCEQSSVYHGNHRDFNICLERRELNRPYIFQF